MKLLVQVNSDLSIRSQCDYLGTFRSSFYHVSKGEFEENFKMMQLMDEHILEESTAGILTILMLKDCSYE